MPFYRAVFRAFQLHLHLPAIETFTDTETRVNAEAAPNSAAAPIADSCDPPLG